MIVPRKASRLLTAPLIAKSFISLIAANLKQPEMAVWHAQRGRHGSGTWAHWQIALAYAKYLSPEFHLNRIRNSATDQELARRQWEWAVIAR